MTLDDLSGTTTFYNKKLFLQNVGILENFLQEWALNKKYIAENDDFEILR